MEREHEDNSSHFLARGPSPLTFLLPFIFISFISFSSPAGVLSDRGHASAQDAAPQQGHLLRRRVPRPALHRSVGGVQEEDLQGICGQHGVSRSVSWRCLELCHLFL